jgi:hypothetical protein
MKGYLKDVRLKPVGDAVGYIVYKTSRTGFTLSKVLLTVRSENKLHQRHYSIYQRCYLTDFAADRKFAQNASRRFVTVSSTIANEVLSY